MANIHALYRDFGAGGPHDALTLMGEMAALAGCVPRRPGGRADPDATRAPSEPRPTTAGVIGPPHSGRSPHADPGTRRLRPWAPASGDTDMRRSGGSGLVVAPGVRYFRPGGAGRPGSRGNGVPMKNVLILGAGFAGLELATRLSEEVPDDVEVTIVDSSDAFVFGFSKLDVMFGRHDLARVRLPYSLLDKPGVRFVQERVVSIDPERRRVTTDTAQYDPDILVVALGADLEPAATPGLLEEGVRVLFGVRGGTRAPTAVGLRGGRRHHRRAGELLQVPGRAVRDGPDAARLPGAAWPAVGFDDQGRQPDGDTDPDLARGVGRHHGRTGGT